MFLARFSLKPRKMAHAVKPLKKARVLYLQTICRNNKQEKIVKTDLKVTRNMSCDKNTPWVESFILILAVRATGVVSVAKELTGITFITFA